MPGVTAPPLAIFLHGSIGVGKTTLGTALAARLGGAYVDGDRYQRRDRPWFASSLSVARGMAEAAIAAAQPEAPVVLGYPLRRVDHMYLKERLVGAGVRALFINLCPPLEAIFGPGRGRRFSDWERGRTAEMIAQGYNDRPWSDARVDTSGPREESVRRLAEAVARLAARPPASAASASAPSSPARSPSAGGTR